MTTVLEVVQETLSAMDSDDVSSINETEESEQMATLVKRCYDDLVDRYDATNTKNLFQLTGLGNTSYPTSFTIPSSVLGIEWIAYDIREQVADAKQLTPITYKTPAEFMDIVTKRDSTASNVQVVTHSTGVEINVYNDKAPEFYTIFDDTQVIMDSFNSNVDTTLQTAKTNCYGTVKQELTLDDTTPIPLASNLIMLLKNEVIELAFELWKEGAPLRIRQDASRSRVRSQRRKRRLQINQERDLFTGPNYGRRP